MIADGPRQHLPYWGFVAHRVSGLLLALFLPVHFWALGLSLRGAASLQGFIGWTDLPLVRFAETGLVVLLAVHLASGLRILALEMLGWRAAQKNLVAVSFGVALACGLAYLLRAF
ncbi:succinate dehydrogenase, cytochrome b556 subunit [Salinisphaera hydrothermalis]|uniref:Succinate dehydrogenase cytochrome b556 subunit n=1 Tax=Salinisphaera hydrothermalis (strain C41B8) TaxID=1304275 RepID=A0A084IPN5_SALHC|nr:succinate dehydrogenase, cytochrome b556 subunit [Salinisphaera hydrothermalis]KEZ78669.1 succinate dehydrogenase/fumarate reductase cytochrome b-556 subunit [Salinisphaera hydrothermalis C41B8]